MPEKTKTEPTPVYLPKVSSGDVSLKEMTGVKAENSVQLVSAIHRGFPFHALELVKRKTGLPMESLAATIGISQRTLSRRRKERRLSSTESDRLVSISRIFALAVDLFEGDEENAMAWLSKPNLALGGISPLVMAQTETGCREVENVIGRLGHGVFL